MLGVILFFIILIFLLLLITNPVALALLYGAADRNAKVIVILAFLAVVGWLIETNRRRNMLNRAREEHLATMSLRKNERRIANYKNVILTLRTGGFYVIALVTTQRLFVSGVYGYGSAGPDPIMFELERSEIESLHRQEESANRIKFDHQGTSYQLEVNDDGRLFEILNSRPT